MTMLETYVRGWHESARSILALADELDDADWSRATDCDKWTVKDILAHLAHLESELCHPEQNTYEPPTGTRVISAYTGKGVEARRDRTPAELVAEFAAAVEMRAHQLTELPDDPTAPAPVTPGGVAWSWDELLRNRAIDVWVHEQDIRRATGRPGGLDSTGAHVAVLSFSFAMPYVLGKRVQPPASAIESLDEPTVSLTMTTETFTVLTAGRRDPDEVEVEIKGDQSLGLATLAAMAIMS